MDGERCEGQVEAKAPHMIIEEHDGSLFISVPAKNLERQLLKGMAYGAVLADERSMWHWVGDFMGACDAVATMMEENPGMMFIVQGVMQARAAARMRRMQEGEGR